MIKFYPKAGMVLMCDFDGYRHPEIVKRRPVVVISPNSLIRKDLCTVVPLSTTAPVPPLPHHYLLPLNPIPGSEETEVWAKCDLVATVCIDRLDRAKSGFRKFETGRVSGDHIYAIRRAAAIALGVEVGPNPT